MSDDGVHTGRGIICNHVLKRERPLNYILHDAENEWTFTCGLDDHEDCIDEYNTICGHCAFSIHVEGLSKIDVPVGFAAERPSRGARWVIRPMMDEELSDEDSED
jgi:hypothetical protein